MASRSLNKVQLIGNLTRDPELRYTPNGAAVCTIGMATNRSWTTDAGERREETEFHRVIAWSKLAEICSQFLTKGRRVYVEGRLRTASWQAADGSQRTTTEIVMEDMIMLDPRRDAVAPAGEKPTPEGEAAPAPSPTPMASPAPQAAGSKKSVAQPSVKQSDDATPPEGKEDVNPDDIPF